MAVATVEDLSFSYTGDSAPALRGVSLAFEPGEVVLLSGRSGSGKTTLIRALAGLVPHFHGGRFSGRVEVGGLDTRKTRPAELAGTVATLFQDPEDQVVFGGVTAEVAFGIENAGAPPDEIPGRVRAALASVGVGHLAQREIGELSCGELQRVCLASTLALEPSLLLVDEPTSELDRDGAALLLRLLRRLAQERGVAVVVSEQRLARTIQVADRVIVLDEGSVRLDASRAEALRWYETERPACLTPLRRSDAQRTPGDTLCRLEAVDFRYGDGPLVLEDTSLELRRGEIVALTGSNGSGKTTLAKVACGLLDPAAGTVERSGRVAYLSQDTGRFLVRERVDEEVSLTARSNGAALSALRALGLVGLEGRHPRDLSSGQRERVALAAVLATEPDMLVLDEPTRGVDPEARRRLAALLRMETQRRATLLITHDDDLVTAVADRVIELGEKVDRVAA